MVATNVAHAVKEFAEKAFDVASMDWQEYIKIFVSKPDFPLQLGIIKSDTIKDRKRLNILI